MRSTNLLTYLLTYRETDTQTGDATERIPRHICRW